MKIARMLVLGVVSVGLLGLQGVPSSAVDATRVIRSYDAFVPPMGTQPTNGIVSSPCDAAHAGELSDTLPGRVINRGPAPVPLGKRTWGYHPTTAGAVGLFRRADSMASLAADQVQVYGDTGAVDGAAFANVGDWFGLASLTVPGGSWQTVQGAGSTSYSWHQTGTSATFTGSISQLLATQITGHDAAGYVGIGFGCNTAPFHFDDAQMGTTGDVLTYDFEGEYTKTAITAAHHTVTAGRSPRLTGSVSSFHDFVDPSPRLVLESRRFGSTVWRKVAGVPATIPAPDAFALLTRPDRATPLRQTTYRWRYVTNATTDGSVSPALRVRVHTTLRVQAPTHVALGSQVVVTGSTLPRKPGQWVTLWHGDHRLGAARVSRTGTFTITAKATFRGRLQLVARIAKSPGNLRGSTSFVVRVR
ncbi:hypothetical protein [Nocardioides cynanchi]|uniref:hypothetical protein n=1 Tax=Nocardioides cynanchi TaxID=2558918 RepID=UPI00124558AD|nr:hypothetical protein [Nocardioides cynanchi]